MIEQSKNPSDSPDSAIAVKRPRAAAGEVPPAGQQNKRRLPIGADVLAGGGVDFRVWAPKRQIVEVELFETSGGSVLSTNPLVRNREGYHCITVPAAEPGMLYGFRLDKSPRLVADPASRYQPEGPTHLSQIVDPSTFRWNDAGWKGTHLEGQVIYELHVGTFTQEGTWCAARRHLVDLAAAGMTVLELMPVNDFLGTFGWGYDGVSLFAPMRTYGTPDDFRQFVDEAHAAGLAVILDVVYNHFGWIGSYEREYADAYHSTRYENESGAPINFDDANSGPVREFFCANVRYWIEEFHLDGFRFDATQSIYDASKRHILGEFTRTAREAAGRRSVILLAENEPQDVRLLRSLEDDGFGFDAMCNDDFHHAARARLTGVTEAYYCDYFGSVDEFRSVLKQNFLYQGQISQHQGKRRGSCSRGISAVHFIHFLQNHDQVANSGTGARIDKLTSPGRLRAMTALWLLSPQTPMFFQGQEFACSHPFLYFADIPGADGDQIFEGRAKFLSQFPSLNTEEARRSFARPADRETFLRSKLDWEDRERNRPIFDLHRDLLKLRREEEVFRRQRADLLEAAALGPDCLAIRFFDEGSRDRLVLVNFGQLLQYSPSPQPLLAPPAGQRWEVLWSSDSVRYGGPGTPDVELNTGWRIPAEAALVLRTVAVLSL